MSSNPSFPVSIPMVSFTQLGDHFISHEIAYTPIYNPHFIWKFLWNSLHLRPAMPGIKCKVATKIAWRTPPPPSPSAPVLWWSTIRGTRPGKHTKNYGRSPFLIGKSTIKINYKWSFSIAMFNYQRVALLHFAARWFVVSSCIFRVCARNPALPAPKMSARLFKWIETNPMIHQIQIGLHKRSASQKIDPLFGTGQPWRIFWESFARYFTTFFYFSPNIQPVYTTSFRDPSWLHIGTQPATTIISSWRPNKSTPYLIQPP